MNVLELTNKVRMEAGNVKRIGLPLDAFPQKLQDIIFGRNRQTLWVCVSR